MDWNGARKQFLITETSFESKSPSPDGRENPFLSAAADAKDTVDGWK